MKTLVAYFSASGNTLKLAKTIAKVTNADLFEIKPVEAYTQADLNWMNSQSRTTLEMRDPASRPALASTVSNAEQYNTIFVGFPIWWYVAPHIINTFLESFKSAGKTIVPFATSGGSDMGKTNEALIPSCPGAKLISGKVLPPSASAADVQAWIAGLKI